MLTRKRGSCSQQLHGQVEPQPQGHAAAPAPTCAALLCRAKPCHAVPSYAMPYHAMPCRAVPCHAGLWQQHLSLPMLAATQASTWAEEGQPRELSISGPARQSCRTVWGQESWG